MTTPRRYAPTGECAAVPWRIVQALRAGPRDVRALTAATGASHDTVRRHLRLAERLGVLRRQTFGDAGRRQPDLWHLVKGEGAHA